MSWYRWLSCAVLLGVLDSTWLYALLGLLGFVAGIGHAPVSWFVVGSVLAISILAHAIHELTQGQSPLRWLLLPMIAALLVWLSVAGSEGPAGGVPGYGWPIDVLFARVSGLASAGMVMVGLLVIFVWRHGAHRARGVVGTPAFARSFRLGLVVFMFVLAFESAGNLDLGTRVAMAPFFLSALLGMALARAPAHGVSLPLWFAIVFATVAFVVVVGLSLSLLLVGVLRGGFGAVRDVWLRLAHAIDDSVSDALVELLGSREATGIDLSSAAAEPSQTLMIFVLLLGALVFAPLVYKLLNAPPAIELPGIVLDLGSAEHESIAATESVVDERWRDALTSRWPWRRAKKTAGQGLPHDPALARVYVLYYEVLERARRRGLEFNPAQTPRERVAVLHSTFPQLPIEPLTAAFEAACYAQRGLSASDFERLAARCAPQQD